jgi:Kef-type K+ transport system membrane component KefB
MMEDIFGYLAILATAYVVGILISKIKLPAILGWLIVGVVFGPYLGKLVSTDFISNTGYGVYIHCFEAFAGVMVGNEINFRELKKTGKQIIITTLFQSLGTFLIVSLCFLATLAIAKKPLYLAFVFGGIALATAPAPALSIVNQYKTDGPVTRTLIPMAALDDIVGVIVFFTVISIVSASLGGDSMSWWMVILMVLLPFAIGISVGFVFSWLSKWMKNRLVYVGSMILFLLISVAIGVVCNYYIFGSSALNFLLIGMAFSAVATNLAEQNGYKQANKDFAPLLSLSLLIVIVNLGMPLDYRAMAGAGVFTAVYIIARAIGKISGAALGAKVTKCDKNVQKYLGLTLLPHSGVSLVFTGIAVNSIKAADPTSASLIQGTIVAAAIINEFIAVILAKVGFTKAGELGKAGTYNPDANNGSKITPVSSPKN